MEFVGNPCRREVRRLRHDEDATMRLGYSPGCGPPAPRIVQEHEVSAVVSHKDSAGLNSREQMDIVGGVFVAEFPRDADD